MVAILIIVVMNMVIFRLERNTYKSKIDVLFVLKVATSLRSVLMPNQRFVIIVERLDITKVLDVTKMWNGMINGIIHGMKVSSLVEE